MSRHDTLPLVESLGDNCEIGFYLEENKLHKGFLLRFAQVRPASAVAFVRSPERHHFAFENLVPFSKTMIKDTATHIAFHTKMRSVRVPDGWRFETPEEERRAIYADDKSKYDYLLERFESRLCSDVPRIYTMKANEGLSEADVAAMDAALRLWKAPERFILLAVNANPEVGTRAGRKAPPLAWRSDTVCHAQVARFAPHVAAKDVDVTSWNRVFDALAMAGKVAGWHAEPSESASAA